MAGEGRAFSNMSEAQMAYDKGELDLQAQIQIRLYERRPAGGLPGP